MTCVSVYRQAADTVLTAPKNRASIHEKGRVMGAKGRRTEQTADSHEMNISP